MQHDELCDAAANGEYHFGVGDDKEEKQSRKGEQVHEAIALKMKQKGLVTDGAVKQVVQERKRVYLKRTSNMVAFL